MKMRRREHWSGGAALLAVVGLVAGVCWSADAADAAQRRGTMEVDGRTRTYFVHLPPGYDRKTKLPLVLVLHGATQSAEGAEYMSGMSAVADAEKFIVAYPSGTSFFGDQGPTWNAGNCCGSAYQKNVDDVAFLRRLILEGRRQYHADEKRVYVTGISNGGMMSFRMACEAADLVAGVAPVAGALNVRCKPSAPVSVIVFHGTADERVPFDGGDRQSDAPVAKGVAFWVKANGCAAKPEHQEFPAVHVDSYNGCKAGTGVALYAIQGGGHTWPGGGGTQNGVPASQIIWKFFAEHPKP